MFFNDLNFKQMPITSRTGQGNPLSGILFVLSTLPAIIKLSITHSLKPYSHKLKWETKPLNPDEIDDVNRRKMETYSDDSFATLLFEGLHTITNFNNIFKHNFQITYNRRLMIGFL